MKGKVKVFYSDKKFGFIEVEGQDKDVFVHWTAIEKDGFKCLNAGDQVEFDVKQTEKGWMATKVKVIE